jgi:hypothetical protein
MISLSEKLKKVQINSKPDKKVINQIIHLEKLHPSYNNRVTLQWVNNEE